MTSERNRSEQRHTGGDGARRGGRGWRSAGEPADPQPVVASLEALARRLGLAGPSALAAVFGRWEDVVGPLLAAHTRPVSLTDGVLVVAVDEPGWATQLRFLTDDVVRRLNEQAGAGTVERCVVQVEGPARRPPGGR